MTLGQSIISSDIISKNEDVFWNEQPEIPETTAGISLLVLSIPNTGDQDEVQLNKMLQACQLTEEQFYILHIDKPLPWHKLREKLKPKVVLLLGVHPNELGISALFRLFIPNHFDDCLWIPSLSLADLEKQPDTKKQLWIHGLKPVFVDKTIGTL
jgi:hypothetical protein